MKLMYFRRFRLNRMMITWIGGTKRLHTYRCCWPLGGEREDWWREREKERKKKQNLCLASIANQDRSPPQTSIEIGGLETDFRANFLLLWDAKRARASSRKGKFGCDFKASVFLCVIFCMSHRCNSLHYKNKSQTETKTFKKMWQTRWAFFVYCLRQMSV